MRAATSSAGIPGDTHQLVDACSRGPDHSASDARVPIAAHLDDEAILPPLPKRAPRRDVVVFTRSQTGVAAAAPGARVAVVAAPPTPIARRPRRRWPLFVCALVASTAGGGAFVVSPAGRRPPAQHVMSSAGAHATTAAHAASTWLSSML